VQVTVPPTIALYAESQADFFRMLRNWYDKNVLKSPAPDGHQMSLTILSHKPGTRAAAALRGIKCR
jgi:hypothetical protein